MMARWIGTSDTVDVAHCRFAPAHADQTQRDHRSVLDAVARGLLSSYFGA